MGMTLLKCSEDEWINLLKARSALIEKYGSFLPEQEQLLKEIYNRLQTSNKNVWTFSSPLASGKTHVIALVSQYLSENFDNVAIVVPSNYLKDEYAKEQTLVVGQLTRVDIISIAKYLKTGKVYDFILVDESHNLKSILELNRNLIKSFSFTPKDGLYHNFRNMFLPPGRVFVAQRVSFASSKEILEKIKRTHRYFLDVSQILQDPTRWMCFVYIREGESCHIKFVNAERVCCIKMPSKIMMLFSASPLSKTELSFYCGIDEENIEKSSVIGATKNWKQEQCIYLWSTEQLSLQKKMEITSRLLEESNCRSLVLFNNSTSCRKGYNELRAIIKKRKIFYIPSGSSERLNLYRSFLKINNAVLLTSSEIFWEGITIEGLKLLVLVETPYPRPHLLNLMKRKIVDEKKDVYRRLLQGMGRIGRRKGYFGVGILLFNPEEVLGKLYSTLASDNKMIGIESTKILEQTLRLFCV